MDIFFYLFDFILYIVDMLPSIPSISWNDILLFYTLCGLLFILILDFEEVI